MDVIVTKGSYTIVEKDGSITVVNYTADEHGFHPEVGEFLFQISIEQFEGDKEINNDNSISVTSSPTQG